MPFNLQKFRKAQFVPRTARVDVSKSLLDNFFDDDDKDDDKVFVVRNLTGPELSIANHAMIKNAKVAVMLAGVTAEGSNAEKVREVREAVGLPPEGTPAEVAKQLEMVVMGTVEPKLELEDAVKLNRDCPVDFALIVNKITELTGLGAELKVKQKASGQSQTSRQA